MVALLLLALGLAMDAFAVSLVRGSVGRRSLADALKLGILFGTVHVAMPLLGWGLGELFADTLRSVDHWVAFGLLLFLGLRMCVEAWRGPDEEVLEKPPNRAWELAVTALATSIDAGASGITLELFGVHVFVACLVIGATAFALSTAGYLFAARYGHWLGRHAELVGGLVLIGLGTKILVEHLGGAG